MPCGDLHDCIDFHSNFKLDKENHEHKEDKQDSCTPFCICSCCGNSIITLEIQSMFSDLLPIYLKVFAVYINYPLSVIYFYIWQPPKIS